VGQVSKYRKKCEKPAADMIINYHFLSKLFFLGLIFCLTSCSFDKMFLKPNKYPQGLKSIRIKTPDDTLVLYFSGNNHQPVFTKRNGRDTVKPLYSIESVLFRSSNGDTLNGWFMKPIDQKPEITLLHFHGNAGSLFSQYAAISPLIKNGFQVFAFDYSGFGYSTGKATQRNVLTDAASALDYVRTRQDVSGTKLIVYGQSYGGHLAAVVAAEKQNEVDALVMEGAFSSPRDIAARRVPILGRLLVKQPHSANKSVKNFHKPILIIHSAEDEAVPFYMGQKLFRSANSPKEFYEIKKCHICGPKYYPAEIADKIKAMLK
jgi:fermentation-respiration switch protein FrsA (DUF1100 family)